MWLLSFLKSFARIENAFLSKGQILFRIVLVWLISGSAIFLANCKGSFNGGQATEDTTYLTPIPEATVLAFRAKVPIESKLQAVIAARASLETTRLRFTNNPKIVSAEVMNLEEAHQRVAQPGVYTYEDRPGDTQVWLVIFVGEWQVFPPDPFHTVTPPSPTYGCTYVIIDKNDSARTEIGEIGCPP